jgi:hypothetical protein
MTAVLCTAGNAFAQNALDKNSWPQTVAPASRPYDPDPPATGLGLLQNSPWLNNFPEDMEEKPATGRSYCNLCNRAHGFFGGADYLLLRTHFSEAYAYARVFQTLTTPSVREVQAAEIPFEYDSSVRVFVGYRLGEDAGDIRFTYWHYRTDARTSDVVGNQAGLNQFIVDPMGSMAQTGDFIRAHESVENNVYDLDYDVPLLQRSSHWALTGSLGLRIADIHQHYQDPILDPTGAVLSDGRFSAHFVGAGPRLGFEARRYFGQSGRLSAYAKGSGALLLGNYDFSAGLSVAGFTGNQNASPTRLVPVAEIEVGTSWQPWKCLTFSAGWLFQAWFDLGASGGQFAGVYVPTDDANIMSFEGLVLRAELAF